MKVSCEKCIFWECFGDHKDTGGVCQAIYAPEPTAVIFLRKKTSIVIHEKTKEAWIALEDQDEYAGDLVTPPDFFCASWQSSK